MTRPQVLPCNLFPISCIICRCVRTGSCKLPSAGWRHKSLNTATSTLSGVEVEFLCWMPVPCYLRIEEILLAGGHCPCFFRTIILYEGTFSNFYGDTLSSLIPFYWGGIHSHEGRHPPEYIFGISVLMDKEFACPGIGRLSHQSTGLSFVRLHLGGGQTC
jgi:hypothetical protein